MDTEAKCEKCGHRMVDHMPHGKKLLCPELIIPLIQGAVHMPNDMPDDYAGGPEPHGYPSYRGWQKTCPPECNCPETIAMRAAWQGSPGALLNEYD